LALLYLATPTYTVVQIAELFEPNIALWTFHTIQPSSFSCDKYNDLIAYY